MTNKNDKDDKMGRVFADACGVYGSEDPVPPLFPQIKQLEVLTGMMHNFTKGGVNVKLVEKKDASQNQDGFQAPNTYIAISLPGMKQASKPVETFLIENLPGKATEKAVAKIEVDPRQTVDTIYIPLAVATEGFDNPYKAASALVNYKKSLPDASMNMGLNGPA